MFRSYNHTECVLCGSREELTGEHKIKRTLIKSEFGEQRLYIGGPDSGAQLKQAQSSKSRAFHYPSRLCKTCNGHRTQIADRAFDQFHELVRKNWDNNQPLNLPFSMPRYSVGTSEYLSVFRFFAKHLCCQIAQKPGAPIPVPIAEFAIGRNNANHVLLNIRPSFEFEERRKIVGDELQGLLSHGGLIVHCDPKARKITGFQSSLTAGPIQYVYWLKLGWIGKIFLRRAFPEYSQWAIARALSDPLNDEYERQRLGID